MRRFAFALLGLLAVAPGHATLINFDDGSITNPIGGFYSPLGVAFSGATWQTNFGLAGVSGPLALASTNANAYKWDSSAPVIATFSSAMSTVSLTAIDLGEDGFTLNAYDAATGGNLVGTMTLFGIGLGNNNFQTLSVSASSIFRVEMFQALSASIDGVIVEDFRFQAVPAPGTLGLLALGLIGGFATRRRA